MRARDPSGGAYGADDVALSHRLAHANIDGIEVRQDGRHSKAVIDHHRAPGEVQVRLGQGDDTVGRAVDGCPGIGSDVDPVVGASRLSIEHPAAAVDPRNGADNRPDEARPIVGLIGIQSPDGSDPGILLSNTRQGFRARGHHAIGQAIDPLGFVSPCSHLERHRLPRSVRIADMESCLRGRVAAKPEDETAVVGYPHQSFVQAYPRSRGRRSKGETALDQVPIEPDAIGIGGADADRQDQRKRESDYDPAFRSDAASPVDDSRPPASAARRVAVRAFRYASWRSKLQ